MAIRGINPSLMATYNICPMQAYFGRISHSKPDVPVWIRKLFGEAMHNFIAYHLYKKSNYSLGFKTKKGMIGFWHIYWSDVIEERGKIFRHPKPYWYREDKKFRESPDTLRGKSSAILSLYWDQNQGQERPSYNEYSIPPLTIPNTGIKINGKMDQIRVDEKTGRHQILDLKTGRGYDEDEGSRFDLERNPQLTFYSLLYRLHFSREENSVGIYHLPTGRIYRTYRNNKDIGQLIESIKRFTRDMEGDRFPRSFGSHCRVCDYRYPCYHPEQYFSGDRELVDERDYDIIFREFQSPPPRLLRVETRTIPKPNVKPHPIPSKPKQRRMKLKFKN